MACTRPMAAPVVVLLAAVLATGARSATDVRCGADLHDIDGIDFTVFDVPAAMLDSVAVEYPAIAVRAGLEGEVEVEVAVLPSGEAVCAVVRLAVHPLLERAALEAAWASRYRPATRDGVPVPGLARVGYTFDLEQVGPDRWRRPDPTPFRWTGPLVGDMIGPPRQGDAKRIHRYQGVVVHGRVSVSVLDTLLAEVRGKCKEGERPDEVWTFDARQPESPWSYAEYGDIRVDTCMHRRADGLCIRGRYFAYFRHGDGFVLEQTSEFFAD